MANKKDTKVTGFQFTEFSKKQLKVLTWGAEDSPTKGRFMLVADGSVRSGKTVICSLSFILHTMSNFNGMNFAICGKSSGAVRRNVINVLKQMLLSLGYTYVDHRADNYLEVSKGNVFNLYHIFGAKDESSADLIQGLTLAGVYFDEIALLPESFFNQATARLSVEGAKVYCCCNPASPYHWFYQKVLKHLKEKNGTYVHFTMDDNLSLSQEVKDRYKTLYSGVFKKRFIEGKWVTADGLIYDMFDDKENIISPDEIPYEKAKKWCIGVDYGTGNATCFLLGFKDSEGNIYICKEYYFEGRKEAQANGDYDCQKTDLEFTEDMRQFIADNQQHTGLTYRNIDIMVDPAAASFKLQLRRYHMKSKNADNNVINGIRTMATFIGSRNFFVSSECSNLIKEIHTYSWDEKAQAHGEDKPIKRFDHACVAGDTLINTTEGYKKIEDMVGTEGYVNTIDPKTGEKCVKKYSSVLCTDECAKILEITMEDGTTLKITSNHPVLTSNGWKQAGELTLEDNIITL